MRYIPQKHDIFEAIIPRTKIRCSKAVAGSPFKCTGVDCGWVFAKGRQFARADFIFRKVKDGEAKTQGNAPAD